MAQARPVIISTSSQVVENATKLPNRMRASECPIHLNICVLLGCRNCFFELNSSLLLLSHCKRYVAPAHFIWEMHRIDRLSNSNCPTVYQQEWLIYEKIIIVVVLWKDTEYSFFHLLLRKFFRKLENTTFGSFGQPKSSWEFWPWESCPFTNIYIQILLVRIRTRNMRFIQERCALDTCKHPKPNW